MSHSPKISTEEILGLKQFSVFLNAAKSYCNFIETEASLNGTEFLRAAQEHLVILYSSGMQLPAVYLNSEIDFNREIEDKQLKEVLNFIGKRVSFSYYWVLLNPVDMNNQAETGTGDLVDDLGDIYKDLKPALLIFEHGSIAAKERAIWKFKFDFDSHWGDHCIEALSAIHHYITENREHGK